MDLCLKNIQRLINCKNIWNGNLIYILFESCYNEMDLFNRKMYASSEIYWRNVSVSLYWYVLEKYLKMYLKLLNHPCKISFLANYGSFDTTNKGFFLFIILPRDPEDSLS